MVYKVVISTTYDDSSPSYSQIVQAALWQMSEFMVAPNFKGTNLPELPFDPIRQILNDTHVFIGVYGEVKGTPPPGYSVRFLEQEYNYAVERGLQCLIFMPKTAAVDEDERLAAFKQRIKESQVVHSFDTTEDLQAQVITALSNYKKTAKHTRKIRPPLPSLRDSLSEILPREEQSEDLETQVARALEVARDDLEAIIRRALVVHDAGRKLAASANTDEDTLSVKPIFGEPSDNSQFQADIFMIMPFREKFDAIFQNTIRPTVADLNMTIKRGDEFASTQGSIIHEVWAAIHACKLVIAETTEENANVYYELGIAHTLGRPAILLTQATDVEDFPFDIRHLRFVVYDNSAVGMEKLEADLKKSIVWLMNDLGEDEGA